MKSNKLVIDEPKDLYIMLRKNLFKNPFLWFFRDGYKLPLIFSIVTLFGMYFKNTPIFTNHTFSIILISFIGVPAIFYPIAYFGYNINRKVIVSNADIWLKNDINVIKLKDIKEINIDKFNINLKEFNRFTIIKNNNKKAIFFTNPNYNYTELKPFLDNYKITLNNNSC